MSPHKEWTMNESTSGAKNNRLARSVMEMLQRSEPLRAVALHRISVEASDSSVLLRGIVPSEAHRRQAVAMASAVPGVSRVVDELVTDRQLEGRVAVALASDPSTRPLRIAVRVLGGVARLYGAVPSEEMAEMACSVARRVGELTGVESRLKIVPPGTPAVLAWQNSLEGRTSMEAANRDGRQAPAQAAVHEEAVVGTRKTAGMEGAA